MEKPTKKIEQYRNANNVIPEKQETWPLFGAGLENLGKSGKPVLSDVPPFSDEELLMRIDAVSLCYTDLKEIDQGDSHPRLINRDLKKNPIIPGHEVSMTVVGVGKNLEKQYQIGDRYTIQPDVWVDGKSIPFCFDMDGGYRQFAKIGHEILHGDAGNYLIPIPDDMTYAASAITEPWACVEASYRGQYRSEIKNNGLVLVVGCTTSRKGYQIGKIISSGNKPSEIHVCEIPDDLFGNLKELCKKNEILLISKEKSKLLQEDRKYDDIILLDLPLEDVNEINHLMNVGGISALLMQSPSQDTIEIDLGRLHYDNIYFVGSMGLNIDDAYQSTMPRVTLKPQGITWVLGAGGPMGRMHLQRALEDPAGPHKIVATEVAEDRFAALTDFSDLAEKHNKQLILMNPISDPQKYKTEMENIIKGGGVDEIEVMIAVPSAIVEAVDYLAREGVMNIFAGLKRGVTVQINPWLICGQTQIRLIGHSGSGLEDQKEVVQRVIDKKLKPELSVAAIGGIYQIHDGIKAMKDNTFPGKIVIFPAIANFPLTALKDLKESAPETYKALGKGNTWTLEAEMIFLNSGLENGK